MAIIITKNLITHIYTVTIIIKILILIEKIKIKLFVRKIFYQPNIKEYK